MARRKDAGSQLISLLLVSEIRSCRNFSRLTNALHRDSIVGKIQEGFETSTCLVVLVSNNSLNSPWVREEISAATIDAIESRGVCLLPVLIEECRMPVFLSNRRIADFTADPKAAYEELLAAIDHHHGNGAQLRRSFLDRRLSIVHISAKRKRRFPVFSFTIANQSVSSQVINRLEYDIVEYGPYAWGA